MIAYLGHLPDGSGIQAHSCGGLYPYVLAYRDKKGGPDNHGKYDCGLIIPGAAEPIWFVDMDTAVAVAELCKKGMVA